MRQADSLEEERQTLLEQIHASRVVYRRMLTHPDMPGDSDAMHDIHSDDAVDDARKFPRSKTMRWVIHHPYLTTLTVAAIVTFGPRNIVRTVINRGTVTTGLTAVTTMLLRDPSKARMVGKAFSVIADLMQRTTARRR